jgi:hypothetical protein
MKPFFPHCVRGTDKSFDRMESLLPGDHVSHAVPQLQGRQRSGILPFSFSSNDPQAAIATVLCQRQVVGTSGGFRLRISRVKLSGVRSERNMQTRAPKPILGAHQPVNWRKLHDSQHGHSGLPEVTRHWQRRFSYSDELGRKPPLLRATRGNESYRGEELQKLYR